MKVLKTLTVATACSLALSSLLFAGNDDSHKNENSKLEYGQHGNMTDEEREAKLIEHQLETQHEDNEECLGEDIALIANKYPLYELTQEQKDDLIFMYQEEKVARDAYLTLNNLWDNKIFENIAKAEQKHMDGVKSLLEKYSLEIPILSDEIGVFELEALQIAYNDLIEKGKLSENDGFEVGKTIEIMDIDDLEKRKIDATEDIVAIYDKLLEGSKHHLDAFNRALSGEDMDIEHSENGQYGHSENGQYKNTELQTNSVIAPITNKMDVIKKLTLDSQEINGYFIHYDTGAYDWAYVTSDGKTVVKLDGMNTNGSLKWTTLHTPNEKGFGKVNISEDGKYISFEADTTSILPGD